MDSYVFSPFFPSPPEFHANHRRIPLQAPRSHQLPPATFRHTLSEGRHLNIRLLRERFFFFSLARPIGRVWKAFSQPRSRCASLCSGFFSLFLESLSSSRLSLSFSHPSLTCLSLSSLSLSIATATRICCSHSVSRVISPFPFARSVCFSPLQVKQCISCSLF